MKIKKRNELLQMRITSDLKQRIMKASYEFNLSITDIMESAIEIWLRNQMDDIEDMIPFEDINGYKDLIDFGGEGIEN